MSGNTTSNSSALRRAEVYSAMVLDTLKDNFLPEGIHRDVSDFQDGDTLHITTFGDLVLRDLAEDQPTPIDPMDSGEITLTITEYVGNGVYMTDKVRQDSWKAQQFDAAIVPKQLRAIKERYETDMLAAGPSGQTASNPNAINGYAHRYVASGANNTMDLEDFIYAGLALTKANAPDEGRIAIVDGLVAASLDNLANIVNVSNNPAFEGIVNTGFAKNMRFVKHVYGFDVYTSNRLPSVTSETVDTSSITVPAPSSSATVTSGKANLFMCIGDDTECPLMGAWRQQPYFEGDRNVPMRRDEFYSAARWGFGLQRTQTLVVVLTNATKYK
jgi:hypothetical protein